MTPTVAVYVQQETVREVVAEGRAAIAGLDIPGATKAAERDALRRAVEKTLGVYISSRTQTKNYQLVKDQVLARTDGYAVLKEVLRTEVGTQEVRVVVRAAVSIRPLAQEVKALGLARAWRVRVVSSEKAATEGVSVLERALTEAGFSVVSARGESDISVTFSPRFSPLPALALDTAAGPMTMYGVRGDAVVRAIRAQTGSVIATFTTAQTARHISAETARTQAVESVVKVLAPKLVDALLVLPSALSQPVQLIVTKLSSVEQATRLEERLSALLPVQSVVRRGWKDGRAEYELDVSTEAAGELTKALGALGLVVSSETKAKIVASKKEETH